MYTTVCFLHYGDVYSFTRARLSCMKEDLSQLLGIHSTQVFRDDSNAQMTFANLGVLALSQITYIAKVSANNDGYVTVVQMPCSVTKKLVVQARKNNSVLMSLGLKGVQITGKAVYC